MSQYCHLCYFSCDFFLLDFPYSEVICLYFFSIPYNVLFFFYLSVLFLKVLIIVLLDFMIFYSFLLSEAILELNTVPYKAKMTFSISCILSLLPSKRLKARAVCRCLSVLGAACCNTS